MDLPLVKDIVFQAGFAGIILVTMCYVFQKMMAYISEKDRRHAKEWESRETQVLQEFRQWRETVGKALSNNTTAMESLKDVIRDTEKESMERHYILNGKLDSILSRN